MTPGKSLKNFHYISIKQFHAKKRFITKLSDLLSRKYILRHITANPMIHKRCDIYRLRTPNICDSGFDTFLHKF